MTQKVAVITGGGSGIGKAAALALASEGFTIVLGGRRPDALNATVEEVEAGGGTALAVPSDVSKPGDVKELFEVVRENFNRIDVLFNNAGQHGPDLPLEDVPLEEWQSVLATNLTGAFLCTQGAMRLMKQQDPPRGGRIINNGSVSAYSPLPNGVAYTCAKNAVTGLTKQTSLEGRDFEIACGQIDIGSCDTDMMRSMGIGGPSFEVEDVGRAIAYMATLPLNANVQSMLLFATKMPFVGRG